MAKRRDGLSLRGVTGGVLSNLHAGGMKVGVTEPDRSCNDNEGAPEHHLTRQLC